MSDITSIPIEQLYEMRHQALLESAGSKSLDKMSSDELKAVHIQHMRDNNPFPASGGDNGPIASLGKFAYGVGAGVVETGANLVSGTANLANLGVKTYQQLNHQNPTGDASLAFAGQAASNFAQNVKDSVDTDGLAGKAGNFVGQVAPYFAFPMATGVGAATVSQTGPNSSLLDVGKNAAINTTLGYGTKFLVNRFLANGDAAKGAEDLINKASPTTAQDIVDAGSSRAQNVMNATTALQKAHENISAQIDNAYAEASPQFKDIPLNPDTWNNLIQDSSVARQIQKLNKEPLGEPGTSSITKMWNGGPPEGEVPTAEQAYALKQWMNEKQFNQYNQPVKPDVNLINASQSVDSAIREVSPVFGKHMDAVAPLMAQKALLKNTLGSDNKLLDLNSIINSAGGETAKGTTSGLQEALLQGGQRGDDLVIGSMAQNVGRMHVDPTSASLGDTVDTLLPTAAAKDNYKNLASPELQKQIDALWAAKQTLLKARSPSNLPVVGHYVDQAKALLNALNLKTDNAYANVMDNNILGAGNLSNAYGQAALGASSYFRPANNTPMTPLQQQFQPYNDQYQD